MRQHLLRREHVRMQPRRMEQALIHGFEVHLRPAVGDRSTCDTSCGFDDPTDQVYGMAAVEMSKHFAHDARAMENGMSDESFVETVDEQQEV